MKPIFQNVLDGQADAVLSGVKASLAAGVDPNTILNEALIAAMSEVGRLFEEGEYFVPEMLVSARAMQAGLSLLKPHLAVTETKSSGKVAIGTVKGDLHDIGKNLSVLIFITMLKKLCAHCVKVLLHKSYLLRKISKYIV